MHQGGTTDAGSADRDPDRQFRNRIRAGYQRNYPLLPGPRADPRFNPGGGYVSKLCHDPQVAVASLHEMLAPYLTSGQLTLWEETMPTGVEMNGNRVRSVTVDNGINGETTVVSAPFVLDATERGDLHPSTVDHNYVDISSWPFQIPLGALIPVRVTNLLTANKNLRTTHITNGCYRLHPVEWTIGEAAWCLDREWAPSGVRNDPDDLAAFQHMFPGNSASSSPGQSSSRGRRLKMPEREIDVRVAEKNEKSIVRDLLEPYLRQLRAFTGGEPNPDGLFTYPYLDHYWPPASESEGRVPFLIRVNGEIAGFILKSTWSNVAGKASAHAIAEFFVVEPWQGQGAGRVAAHAVFDRFPGRWEIAALDANHAAKAFWRRVINEYTGGAFEEIALDTDAWHGPVWRFETPFNEASYTQGDRCTCRPVSRPAARPAAKEDS